jgi:hypothetical protein
VRSSLCSFFSYETQQLKLGIGTAIWWVTEPHYTSARARARSQADKITIVITATKSFTVQATGVRVIKLSLFATDTSGK